MENNRLKVSKDKDTYLYKIDCYNPKDYTLILEFNADTKLLKKIWNVRKSILLRTKGIDVRKHELEEVKKFEVPKEYYNFMKVATNKAVLNCLNIFKKDGIIILSWAVKKAVYTLTEAKGWKIIITYGGIYTK